MPLMMKCWWTLALSACLVLTVQAECGRECALCVYRLFREQRESDTLTCTLECEGTVDLRKLEICKDILTEGERLDISNVKQEDSTDHLLTKKYGGFMKRYGGFMIKKSAEEIGTGGQSESDATDTISKKYGGFMKKDRAEGRAEDQQVGLLRDILNIGLSSESENRPYEDVAKRYGGFMRSVQGNSGLGETVRDLHKRYGGFMRRVGRPDWLDNQKSNGFPKRIWEDGGETALPAMQKRYGGFMD